MAHDIFFNILDIASIAAAVIFRLKFYLDRLAQKDSRRFFQLEIAKGLAKPQIECRRKLKSLPKQLQTTVDQILDRQDDVLHTRSNSCCNKKKMCVMPRETGQKNFNYL